MQCNDYAMMSQLVCFAIERTNKPIKNHKNPIYTWPRSIKYATYLFIGKKKGKQNFVARPYHSFKTSLASQSGQSCIQVDKEPDTVSPFKAITICLKANQKKNS